MNIRYLVEIEIRYHKIPESEYLGSSANKKIAIAVCDTFKEAVIKGNNALSSLQDNFGFKFQSPWFGEHTGPLGTDTTLVVDMFSTKGIEIFAKIKTLRFEDLSETVRDVLNKNEAYRRWKNKYLK